LVFGLKEGSLGTAAEHVDFLVNRSAVAPLGGRMQGGHLSKVASERIKVLNYDVLPVSNSPQT
jgi:hypothetical protein